MGEMVYACTAHNEYACRECVPRAVRLTVDALLDECVMVEQEVEQAGGGGVEVGLRDAGRGRAGGGSGRSKMGC